MYGRLRFIFTTGFLRTLGNASVVTSDIIFLLIGTIPRYSLDRLSDILGAFRL